MNRETTPSFLGRGWSFPPTFDKTKRGAAISYGREDIEESLEILLGTRPGERIMRPGYGCNLDEMVFEAFNESVKTYLADLIQSAILYHEPRIELLNVTISEEFIHDGRLMIDIEYMIRATNSRFNMVFPFYLNEGTEI